MTGIKISFYFNTKKKSEKLILILKTERMFQFWNFFMQFIYIRYCNVSHVQKLCTFVFSLFGSQNAFIQTQLNKNISLIWWKTQSSIEKFYLSNGLPKTQNFSFNPNIKVPLESVDLFLHIFPCVKVILTSRIIIHNNFTHNRHLKIRNKFFFVGTFLLW